MQESGLVSVKRLLEGGFYHNNLDKMAQCCREEAESNRLVSSYILCGIFSDLAEVVEAEPKVSKIKSLEARYKPIIISLVEKVISGSSLEDQFKILTELIQLNWKSENQRRVKS